MAHAFAFHQDIRTEHQEGAGQLSRAHREQGGGAVLSSFRPSVRLLSMIILKSA